MKEIRRIICSKNIEYHINDLLHMKNHKVFGKIYRSYTMLVDNSGARFRKERVLINLESLITIHNNLFRDYWHDHKIVRV